MSNDTLRPVRLYAGQLVWRGRLPQRTIGEILGHLRQLSAGPRRGVPADGVLEIAPEDGRDGSGRLVVRWSAIDAVELLDEAPVPARS
jgi:hypothetical protein